ncbi:hypothetical protein OESDEN_16102, partial [Oesophagostomum dentatum]
TLPLQFATASQAAQISGVAASTADALKNVRQYVKKAVVQTVRAEARKAGVENLVSSIASQIKPIVYYPIMLCGGKSADGKTGCSDLKEGYCCVLDQNQKNITGIVIGTSSPADIPEGYQRIIVSLAISNAVIGGWSRDTWRLKLFDVETKLRNGAYGENFKYASVRLL